MRQAIFFPLHHSHGNVNAFRPEQAEARECTAAKKKAKWEREASVLVCQTKSCFRGALRNHQLELNHDASSIGKMSDDDEDADQRGQIGVDTIVRTFQQELPRVIRALAVRARLPSDKTRAGATILALLSSSGQVNLVKRHDCKQRESSAVTVTFLSPDECRRLSASNAKDHDELDEDEATDRRVRVFFAVSNPHTGSIVNFRGALDTTILQRLGYKNTHMRWQDVDFQVTDAAWRAKSDDQQWNFVCWALRFRFNVWRDTVEHRKETIEYVLSSERRRMRRCWYCSRGSIDSIPHVHRVLALRLSGFALVLSLARLGESFGWISSRWLGVFCCTGKY